MRRVWALGLCLALMTASAACFFSPAIAGDGYTDCQKDSQCGPGRHCELGLCLPPAWYDEQYSARYQVLVQNPASEPTPEGRLAELTVGEGADLSLDDVGYAPTLILDAAGQDKARPAVALRDPRGTTYAFVFRLPQAIPAGATNGDLWLYVGGDASQAVSYSPPEEVFTYYETFAGDSLSSERFRSEGTINLSSGDALLRPGAWLVSEDSFVNGAVSVEAQLTGSSCDDYGIGLSAGRLPQSLSPPYALFSVAAGSNQVVHQVQASSLSPLQEIGDAFFADGERHRFRIEIVGDRVRFVVDERVTAEEVVAAPLDAALHLHLYSRSCTLRVLELRAQPAVQEAPVVSLSDRVVWFP